MAAGNAAREPGMEGDHETRDPHLSGLQQASLLPGFGGPSHALVRRAKSRYRLALHEYNATQGEYGEQVADERADDIADRWGLDGKDRAVFFGRARSMDRHPGRCAVRGAVMPSRGRHGRACHRWTRCLKCARRRFLQARSTSSLPRQTRSRTVHGARETAFSGRQTSRLERRTRGAHCTELAGSSVRAARCKVDRS